MITSYIDSSMDAGSSKPIHVYYHVRSTRAVDLLISTDSQNKPPERDYSDTALGRYCGKNWGSIMLQLWHTRRVNRT